VAGFFIVPDKRGLVSKKPRQLTDRASFLGLAQHRRHIIIGAADWRQVEVFNQEIENIG